MPNGVQSAYNINIYRIFFIVETKPPIFWMYKMRLFVWTQEEKKKNNNNRKSNE